MKIKRGVSIAGIQPETVVALLVAEGVFGHHKATLTVTSCTDSKHGRASLHYVGFAIDLRTRDIPQGVVGDIAEDLRNFLGDQYDVVREDTHLHVEFQPK